jgi:hypothetical protein
MKIIPNVAFFLIAMKKENYFIKVFNILYNNIIEMN